MVKGPCPSTQPVSNFFHTRLKRPQLEPQGVPGDVDGAEHIPQATTTDQVYEIRRKPKPTKSRESLQKHEAPCESHEKMKIAINVWPLTRNKKSATLSYVVVIDDENH